MASLYNTFNVLFLRYDEAFVDFYKRRPRKQVVIQSEKETTAMNTSKLVATLVLLVCYLASSDAFYVFLKHLMHKAHHEESTKVS